MRFSTTFAILSLALMPSTAFADSAAVQSFTGGSLANIGATDLPRTVGWAFKPTANLTVTQLGFWDEGLNGLLVAHDVGIWTSSGTLLASGTVGAGVAGTLVGAFRYTDVGDFSLAGGQSYTIGATILQSMDNYTFAPASVSADPLVGYVGGLRTDVGPGLVMPTLDANSGRFGPNFLFTAAASVPEPASWAMMIAGFGLVGGSLRTRRTKVSARLA